jgi:hypothetical protein
MIGRVCSRELASILCRLLVKYTFQLEDIRTLIRSILGIQDDSLKSELCAILIGIVTPESIPSLFSLLDDTYAAIPVIEFLMVHCRVEEILICCGEKVLTQAALHHIYDFINAGNPSALPITCWIAINLKESDIEYLIHRINLKQNYYISGFSLLWPTCLLFSPEILRALIAVFLYRVFPDHFCEVYGCVEIVGNVLASPDIVDDIKSDILMPVSRNWHLMTDFLVYRRRPYWNQELRRLMKIEVPVWRPLSWPLLPNRLYAAIARRPPMEFCFGMRVKKENEWVDLQLAKFLLGPVTTRKRYLETMVARLDAGELPEKM